MKFCYLLPAFAFLFLFLNDSVGQAPCLPAPNGELAGNDAPGCLMCGPIYSARNEGYSPSAPGSAGFPCGTIENNFFLSITVGSTGTLNATMLASNCVQNQGVQLIIFDQNFNPVSNCFSANGTLGAGNVIATGLIPGDTYWMMVDGFAGDICDVLITTSGGVYADEIGTPDAIHQTPDDDIILIGTEVCFSIPSVQNATTYDWQIPSGATITRRPSITEICLTFPEAACEEIGLSVQNNCFQESVVPISVSVQSALPEVKKYNICKGGSVIIGETIFDLSGSGSITLENGNQFGCDSIILYEVNAIAFPEISPEAPDSIPCRNDCVPINVDIISSGNFNYLWRSSNGILGTGFDSPNSQACSPGIYQLNIFDANQNHLCLTEIEVNGFSNAPPIPTPVGWADTACWDSNLFYEIEAPDPNVSILWEISGGFFVSGVGTNRLEVFWSSGNSEGEVCVSLENGCAKGEKFCQTIQKGFRETIDFTFTDIACEDDDFIVNFSGQGTLNTVYEWDFGAMTVLNGNGTGRGPITLNAPQPGTFPVQLIVKNNGCPSFPVTHILTADNEVEAVGLECFADWDSLVFKITNMPNPSSLSLFAGTGQIGRLVDSFYIFNNLSPLENVNFSVFAQSEFNACNSQATIKSCRSLPCPEVNIDYPTTPIYLCPGDIGEFTVAPVLSITTDPLFDGAGDFEIISDFLTPDLTFKAEDIPVGRSEFTIHYEENYCVYDLVQAIERIDTTPVVIECLADTFLTSVALRWSQTQADEYDIFLNGDFFNTVSSNSLLIPVDGLGSEVEITIQPKDISGCVFPPTTLICPTPNVVSVSEKDQSNDFLIIPNPSSGIFNIKSHLQTEQIEVFAPSGKKVLEADSNEIDLTGFSKGVYFFKIRSEKGVFVRRAVLI